MVKYTPLTLKCHNPIKILYQHLNLQFLQFSTVFYSFLQFSTVLTVLTVFYSFCTNVSQFEGMLISGIPLTSHSDLNHCSQLFHAMVRFPPALHSVYTKTSIYTMSYAVLAGTAQHTHTHTHTHSGNSLAKHFR